MLPDVPLISAITLAELSVGPLVTDDAAERARRLAHVQQAEADFDPLPFDAAAARAFGQVASSLCRSGRKPAARALDALIAAITVASGLPVYTCNPADFAGIDGPRRPDGPGSRGSSVAAAHTDGCSGLPGKPSRSTRLTAPRPRGRFRREVPDPHARVRHSATCGD
ncbi:MAG TPA: type II toxin-antitoxin system VapC family toxin [Acidimicrobiales bacterium]|nr:type II toxin-antitoxin system VapC family toxin [Acidimicrobiales bacterium]